jgi:hypothetical protein
MHEAGAKSITGCRHAELVITLAGGAYLMRLDSRGQTRSHPGQRKKKKKNKKHPRRCHWLICPKLANPVFNCEFEGGNPKDLHTGLEIGDHISVCGVGFIENLAPFLTPDFSVSWFISVRRLRKEMCK